MNSLIKLNRTSAPIITIQKLYSPYREIKTLSKRVMCDLGFEIADNITVYVVPGKQDFPVILKNCEKILKTLFLVIDN